MILPSYFIEKLKERRIIPFVGAGVSMNIKDRNGNRVFPNWKELLSKSVEQLKEFDNEDTGNIVSAFLNHKKPDYLQAAKYAYEGLGVEWNDFLDGEFNPARESIDDSSLEIGRLIWQLGSSLIITTNYDKVLKWTNDSVEIWDIESRFRQGKVFSQGLPKEPTVWHLHGYIENPSHLILTPDGYQKLYPNDEAKTKIKYEAALTTLRAMIASYTFLFIGFSFSDAEFANQIKEISDLFDGATSKHYVLVTESEKGYINNLNLPVKAITYENHGEPLFKLLREIIETSRYSPVSIETDAIAVSREELVNENNQKKQEVQIIFREGHPYFESTLFAENSEVRKWRFQVRNIGDRTLFLEAKIDFASDEIPFVRIPLTPMMSEDNNNSAFNMYSGDKQFVNLIEWQSNEPNKIRFCSPPKYYPNNVFTLDTNQKLIIVVMVFGTDIKPSIKRFSIFIDESGLQIEEVKDDDLKAISSQKPNLRTKVLNTQSNSSKTISAGAISLRVTSLTFIVETNKEFTNLDSLEITLMRLIKRHLPTRDTKYHVNKVENGLLVDIKFDPPNRDLHIKVFERYVRSAINEKILRWTPGFK